MCLNPDIENSAFLTNRPYDSGGLVPWVGVGVPQKITEDDFGTRFLADLCRNWSGKKCRNGRSLVGIGHAVCRESTFWIPACAEMTACAGMTFLRGGRPPPSRGRAPFVIPAQAGIQKDPWRPYLTTVAVVGEPPALGVCRPSGRTFSTCARDCQAWSVLFARAVICPAHQWDFAAQIRVALPKSGQFQVDVDG